MSWKPVKILSRKNFGQTEATGGQNRATRKSSNRLWPLPHVKKHSDARVTRHASQPHRLARPTSPYPEREAPLMIIRIILLELLHQPSHLNALIHIHRRSFAAVLVFPLDRAHANLAVRLIGLPPHMGSEVSILITLRFPRFVQLDWFFLHLHDGASGDTFEV